MSEPRFAVVGHPNKGKSSIVATLASDDSVAIAPKSGTTKRTEAYPMRIDGEVLYTLVDTPGFQRRREVLEWLHQHQTSADKNPQVVADFVAQHADSARYVNEVELLRPLVDKSNPAGVLYVVDGSVPYGSEYEAEMEVLRWTGQPSLALINPIGKADHIEAWRAALGQYFKVVRVFNAVTAEFDKRLELLRAFGQLRDTWRRPLERAVAALEADRARRRHASADAVAELLVESLTLSLEQRLPPGSDVKPHEPKLLEKYRGELRRLERRSRERVEAAYDHHGLDRREGEVEPLEEDLFSESTWATFGLSRRNLATLGVVSGGAAGAVGTHWIDLVLGGATLGAATAAGGVVGAAIGGAAGWIGAGKLAEVRLINQPLGGRLLRCGPTRNVNFPFVLLGRARYHHLLVAGRTHAVRGALELDPAGESRVTPLATEQRKALAAAFKRVPKAGGDLEEHTLLTRELAALVEPILAADDAPRG